MGDYRVISGVTQALARSVQRAVSNTRSSVSHAVVSTRRPDKPDPADQPRVNIYLFHVQPNPSLRNLDLPTRSEGLLEQAPTVALDLYYLFSFYGNDQKSMLESQLLMGLTMSALHAKPFIEPSDLRHVLHEHHHDGIHYQQVELAIETMSVHELSRLWQTFPQVPLVLSTAYRATAVLITQDEDDVTPALPVLEREFILDPGHIQDDLPSSILTGHQAPGQPGIAKFLRAVINNAFRRGI